MQPEQIYTIPLANLREIDENVRRVYDEEEMAQLMVSMSRIGLLQPIGVTRIPGDKENYHIVWGHRRYRAAQKLGWEVIDSRLTEAKNEVDMLVKNANENLHRAAVSFPEQGRQFEALMRKYDMTKSQVAARMNVTKSYVENALEAYQKIPERIRHKITHGTRGQTNKKGNIPVTSAFNVQRIVEKYRLKANDADKLYRAAADDDMSSTHVKIAGHLIATGVPVEKAVAEAQKRRLITLMVSVDEEHALTLERRKKTNIHDIAYTWLEQNDELKLEPIRRSHEEKTVVVTRKAGTK